MPYMVYVGQRIFSTDKIHIPETILSTNHEVLTNSTDRMNAIYNHAITYCWIIALIRIMAVFPAIGTHIVIVVIIYAIIIYAIATTCMNASCSRISEFICVK
jgi:hypothetical protein